MVDICKVLEHLIEEFEKIDGKNFKVYYVKVALPAKSTEAKRRKIWLVLWGDGESQCWPEYTQYPLFERAEDTEPSHIVYGSLVGTNVTEGQFALLSQIKTAVELLRLRYYEPDDMPDSDVFFDNFSKLKKEPGDVTLWYEFLLKLSHENECNIRYELIKDVPFKELPCTIGLEGLKTDVLKASKLALEYLLEKAKHNFKQAKGDLWPAATGEKTEENIFRNDGDKWTVVFNHSKACYIEDSKGMAYIAHLLGNPHKPVSALKLADLLSGAKLLNQSKVAKGESVGADSGKPQDLVDKDYLRDSKNRLGEIEEELRKAKENSDQAEEYRLEREKEQILNQLSLALNLSGKSRSFPDAIKKARNAVAVAINRALKKIENLNKPLYYHLNNSIQRGKYFVYIPDRKISWEL